MRMNLHDLAEELPIKWQTIMIVAQQSYDAFKALEGGARGFEGSKGQSGLRLIGKVRLAP